MNKAKIAITIEEPILKRVDRLIEAHIFSNRSQAIGAAVEEKLERLEHGRLARECAKLDPVFEQAVAEEGLDEVLSEWPEY
jgi:metal-responsive CopG/Arc/MetJ family transcriptional regulator